MRFRSFIFLFLFGVLFKIELSAQLNELDVLPLEAPDRIAVFANYPDHAAIIIRSNLTNLRFDSNVEVVADLSSPNDGEYRIIINPFRQNISVSADGFMQARFNVAPKNAREVLYYEIYPKEQDAQVLPVNILVEKTGGQNDDEVSIYVDNQLISGERNPYSLTPGEHIIRIEAGEKYRVISDTINVDFENTLFNYTIEELELVILNIDTDPSVASLIINGEPDQIPYSDFKYPGEYFIQIDKDGYRRLQQTIVVEEGVDNEFTFPLIRSQTSINLTVEPSDATISLNRRDYTNQTLIPLTDGLYRLEIRKDGYEPYIEQFEIALDEQLSRNIRLEQLIGDLQVRVTPLNAKVTVRNSRGELVQEWEGTKRIELPIGDYLVESNLLNHDEIVEQVSVTTGQTTNVRMDLIQTQGVGSLEIVGMNATNASMIGNALFQFDELPANVETIRYGTYNLKANQKGFKDIDETIEFRQAEMTIDLFEYYEPKRKFGAFTRSLLFPGAGQLYLDRSRGLLYLLGEGALIGLAISAHQDYQEKQDAYNIALNNYQSTSINFDARYQEVLTTLDNRNQAIDTRNLMIMGFLGLKGLELFDIMFLTKSPKRQLKRAERARLRATQNGVALSYNF